MTDNRVEGKGEFEVALPAASELGLNLFSCLCISLSCFWGNDAIPLTNCGAEWGYACFHAGQSNSCCTLFSSCMSSESKCDFLRCCKTERSAILECDGAYEFLFCCSGRAMCSASMTDWTICYERAQCFCLDARCAVPPGNCHTFGQCCADPQFPCAVGLCGIYCYGEAPKADAPTANPVAKH
jgi:hypothetical protein